MTQNLSIRLISFGHSFGVPKETDLTYSVRHLSSANIKSYRRYDGRHSGLQNVLLGSSEYENFLAMIREQVENFILDHQEDSISIAVGCEQGRHRSVAIVERLAEEWAKTYDVHVEHRDLQRTRFNKDKQRERTFNRDRKYTQHHEHS